MGPPSTRSRKAAAGMLPFDQSARRAESLRAEIHRDGQAIRARGRSAAAEKAVEPTAYSAFCSIGQLCSWGLDQWFARSGSEIGILLKGL